MIALFLALLVGVAAAQQCLVDTFLLSQLTPCDPSAPATEDKKTHSNNDYPVVNVHQGSLRGKKVISRKTGGVYYSFQGIPYAQPPVGALRFQAPKEAEPWTGVRDATTEGSICSQPSIGRIVGSEDCLFLNVYTPKLVQQHSARKPALLPVMMWIHGGAVLGSGNCAVYGPDYLVNKGVIVVTANYRQGVLGFLGLNNSLVSQNNGLKDLVVALKWIQKNIAQFGGDKNKVTIFGQSFGSINVEFLVLSPMTKGLVHRAISESGNALSRWAYAEPRSTKERAFLLGQLLGLKTENENELVEFLNSTSAERLVTFQSDALTEEDRLRSIAIPFLPTKEQGTQCTDVLLPDSPVNMLKSGRYQKVPFMTGFSSTDTKEFYMAFLDNETLWEELSNNMEQFVPPELDLPLGSPQSLEIAAEIKKKYFGDATPTTKNIRELIILSTDAFYAQGARRTIHHRLKTSSTPLYMYQFSYVGKFSISEFCNFTFQFRGASHSDELRYLFWVHNIEPERISAADRATLNRMTTMWTNFAKTGNPNGGLDFKWDSLTTNRQKYLDIDAQPTMRELKQLRPENFSLWDRLYASIDNW